MIAASILIAPLPSLIPLLRRAALVAGSDKGAVQRLSRSTSCRQHFGAAVPRRMLLARLFTQELPLRFGLGVNKGITGLPR
jgi:hypothetical protein